MPETQHLLLGAPGTPAAPSLDLYRQQGGYTALRQALTSLTPAQVLAEIRAAGLRGRGGAGVLTAEKMGLVARADAEMKYLVCNAYDADTRCLVSATLLERQPHLVLEGMALAAYALGASEGYLYVRSTRDAAAASVQAALREALEQGALGRAVLGSRFDFAITVVGVERGFMGGEESSLLEIIKGRPMKAQQRPPYPTEYGLQGHPTLVQNAETLANLPAIVARGGEAFRTLGTEATSGTKLLTIYGPGAGDGDGVVVEVPFGTTLAQAVRQAGITVSEANARAVVVGGKEGGALPLNQLATPLDFEPLEQAGAIIGSSVIEVLPADTCMVRWAMQRADYLAGETCGKCVPCRVGVKRVAATLEGVTSSIGAASDLDLLKEFIGYIADGSLCGFGVNAVNPVRTALRYFGDDFSAHLEGHCPTGTCTPVRAHRYVTKHVL